MDSKAYQLVRTDRNIQYNVYYAKATKQSTTLLFVHGFPSSSYDWHHQVSFFTKLGYGVIVPDMLGYGGTDKPLDYTLYAHSLVANDLVNIIDGLNVQGPLVAIGHDWGAFVVARLANIHQDRFGAFGFLSIGYQIPNATATYDEIIKENKRLYGRQLFGYWDFLSEENAIDLIEQHYESFMDLLLAYTATSINKISEIGGFRPYLLQDIHDPLPNYLTPEEAKIKKEIYRKSGIKASLNWYKVVRSDLDREDASKIPKEKYQVNKPVFYGRALNDWIAIPAIFDSSMAYTPQLTIRNYEAAHWVHWEKRDELNHDLKKWLEAL
ncbi:Alpha/Beta hydrolase protein [Crepidotus variabilis]|uniref:Alpha/Beta hydrolase protein n=1 Tax=Crepidotus variabilis TaxID=179855 RepID=A0A9P6JSK9_9AGAR|nr:Alpha/Beta hydrolase protein [Crepidotus variabilis]